MRYIHKEISCCGMCPYYEYNGIDDVHWCDELEIVLKIHINTIDPECPLPKSLKELIDAFLLHGDRIY